MKLQVGVKVLIQNKSNRYLLIRRSVLMAGETEPHWDIPGGRINPEETLHDALAREIVEETGLSVVKDFELLNAQDIFVAQADLHVVRLTYHTYGDGDPVVSDEHQEFTWVSIDDAQKLNLDPYLREVIEKQFT